MENKTFWTTLINPFTRIAGWQALLVGIIISCLTAIIASHGNLAFDGVIDAHIGGDISYSLSFMFVGIDIISVVFLTWIAAVILSKSYRFIDILGTMTLARAPMILLAVVSLFIELPANFISDPIAGMKSGSMIAFMTVSIIAIIWFIVLMYHAMKVSLNIKGVKLTVSFIIMVFLAEVLSKVALYQILK